MYQNPEVNLKPLSTEGCDVIDNVTAIPMHFLTFNQSSYNVSLWSVAATNFTRYPNRFASKPLSENIMNL